MEMFMKPILSAEWIKPVEDYGDICPVFRREFSLEKPVRSVELYITALGVYEASLNGERIGKYILAPGWTSYNERLQYQVYNITEMVKEQNELKVNVGKGWCLGRLGWNGDHQVWADQPGLIAAIRIEYENGNVEVIGTDRYWETAHSPILFSEIYDGEVYDARIDTFRWQNAVEFNHSRDILIPQEGEIIREIEELKAEKLIITPAGEKVIDFGQNITGYVYFKLDAAEGEIVEISHAEVLDSKGNFYTDNLRTARQKIKYICSGSNDHYKPHHTFQGFRYIRLDSWPAEINLDDFRAVVVHSDMKRTGYFESSNTLLNSLFQNIIWGQKGNFLDVPTDCPQRDERFGWTGDAQVFVRAASYNYDVERFFRKWLHDLKSEQGEDGGIPHVIPDALGEGGNSAAWADAAVICPWQIYLTYGNKEVLEEQFDSMQNWVEYMRREGDSEYLWNSGTHFGDWLALDAVEGRKGLTDFYLIATAFYAYSTSLLIKAGRVLGKDMTQYEALYRRIVQAFNEEYLQDGRLKSSIDSYYTQTAHVLVLYFNLSDNKEAVAEDLAELIRNNGNSLSTGFVGTPYLLHVLSDNGYAELAYTLLLKEDYPSWLYPVRKGATTIWEHWDSIRPDGTMWSPDMNSFNHYAYGSVADWMYGVMAGINIDEEKPGFKHIIFKPIVDRRLDYVNASIESRYGIVSSSWKLEGKQVSYEFEIPAGCSGWIILGDKEYEVTDGKHQYLLELE